MNLSENARHITRDPHLSLPSIPLGLARLGSELHRIGIAWAARRRRSRETRELYAMGDRDLWDMGLCRSDLPAIIAGSYRRD
jgi:uncharacterized protein YjiS (DUF1127 family)